MQTAGDRGTVGITRAEETGDKEAESGKYGSMSFYELKITLRFIRYLFSFLVLGLSTDIV